MNLYVCGTTKTDPEQWSIWDEITLVLAESVDQARQMTDAELIVPVDMSKPAILGSFGEPSWGEDL